MNALPSHLETLKNQALQTSCESWALRHRWRLGPGLDRSGPCPLCGGKDRFSIHTKLDLFNCRHCGLTGKGVIELVMKTEKVGFVEACEIVTGRKADAPVDPETARRAAERAAREEERRKAEAGRYREKARAAGNAIWKKGFRIDGDHSAARDYLTLRGLDAALLATPHPPVLKCAVALDYRHKVDGDWLTLHTGPALLAAIQRRDGRFGGVHQTWIDLARPKGRAVLTDPDGNGLPGKKVLGSKKGGAIRLFTPENPRRIVMGEGIETTATPLSYVREPDTSYWAGVDLGNLAGRALRDSAGKLVHDQPDMDDLDCFVPPDWCQELVFLAEGDDPRSHVTEKLTRGLRRAMRLRPGLRCFIVPAPGRGQDMNDLVGSEEIDG